MDEEWVHIGAVRSVRPDRRELRVVPEPAHQHEFEYLEWVSLRPRDAASGIVRRRVAQVSPAGNTQVITLAPGISFDAVAALRGASVVLEKGALHPAHGRMWQPEALSGFRVCTKDGVCLGTVSAVYATGMNEAIEIEKTGGGRMLLPLIEDLIEEVQEHARMLVVGDIAPFMVDDDE